MAILAPAFRHVTKIALILAVVVGGSILIRTLSRRVLESAEDKRRKIPHLPERERRLNTLVKLLDTSLRVLLWGAGALMILNELGLDITPLLTGAGIAGVAIGFGAQSLVKDVISGCFILIEDQIRVGDFVKVNNQLSGTVEWMQLRVTAIRDRDGTLNIIPNGQIQSVSNMTYNFGRAVVEIPLAYQTDLKKLNDSMTSVAETFAHDPQWKTALKSEPPFKAVTFLGITRFEGDHLMATITADTEPQSRWAVERELRQQILHSLEASGIKMR